MRQKPHRKGHHARPRTVRPKTDEAQSSPENGAAATATATRRKCVLVVEDNATVGGLLVALLREEGYRALRAWDGREAMKMARDRRPDLVVLDLSLPYRDGIEVLRELRANVDTAEAPMVIVSGSATQVSQDDRALVSDAITRPFDIDRLLNVFRRHLGDPEADVPERPYGATDNHLNSW
ncbi:MAG: response regulator [Chloroflexi bacterium]|nr:response regulator [Chloroflexota bacterium]